MSVYFSQPCPIPYHIIHPQFFLFFSKKLHNALWKIAHIGRKYFLPLIQAQALYFIFYGEHSMNHSLILKIFSLHPPGNMRRAWHWFEAGYNETKQLYHSTNCISLYFWYIENIRYKILPYLLHHKKLMQMWRWTTNRQASSHPAWPVHLRDASTQLVVWRSTKNRPFSHIWHISGSLWPLFRGHWTGWSVPPRKQSTIYIWQW